MLLSEDQQDEKKVEEARRWAYEADYEVHGTPGTALAVEATIDGKNIGRAEIAVELKDGEAKLKLAWSTHPRGQKANRTACAKFLGDPHRLKVYYDSGHTLSQGHLYQGGYSDVPFDWAFHSFDGFRVDQEKPDVAKGESLADKIAIPGDNSLFAWVCKKLFVNAAGNPIGWLASDDGSMEMADFIHIDPDGPVVSLVHVKASDSTQPGRQAKPSDFELVVSQAVKNVRYLERRKLWEELERGKAKKIGAAVWHNGVRVRNRADLIACASKLPARTAKRLIVLQPRMTKAEVDYCRSDAAPMSRATRMKQIDTMMLAARASALACGASFTGIADQAAAA